MFGMDKMKMKEKLIGEIMDMLDGDESEKLKPKEAALVSVSAKPEEEADYPETPGKSDDDDEMSDDDLKSLLRNYMKG